MKAIIILLFIGLSFFLCTNLFSQVVQRSHLDGNNIDSYLQNTGIYYQSTMPDGNKGMRMTDCVFRLISIQASFVYFIVLKTEKGIETHKIILQK